MSEEYHGYIKDIWLELPEYEFQHCSTDKEEDGRWVGRKDIGDKLHQYLADGESGAYLVTGYRGMGKTSFVKKTIERYKTTEKKKRAVKEITISFGQKDIKEVDILRQIVKGLMDNILPHKWVKALHEYLFSFNKLPVWATIVFLIILLSGQDPFNNILSSVSYNKPAVELYNSDYKLTEQKKIQNNEHITTTAHRKTAKQNVRDKLFSKDGLAISASLLVSSLMIGFLALLICRFLFRLAFSSTVAYDKLGDLYDRCRSNITREDGGGGHDKLPFSLVNKSVKSFPMANPKEMENEIIHIIKKYTDGSDSTFQKGLKMFFLSVLMEVVVLSFLVLTNGHYISLSFLIISYPFVLVAIIFIYFLVNMGKEKLYKRKFIFVFDEIDKVDPAPSENSDSGTDTFDRFTQFDLNSIRERKRTVISILANLKYLITAAKAKFVFIAGREMFDAALADIADRQSSISSIFNEVIYVDSLLKDKSHYEEKEDQGRTMGLSTLVEDYLENIMLPKKKNKRDTDYRLPTESFVKNYYTFLSSLPLTKKENKNELASPSTDTDKEEFEHAKRMIIFNLQNFIVYLAYRSNGSPKKMIKLVDELVKVVPVSSDLQPVDIGGYRIQNTDKEIRLFTSTNNGKPAYFLHINYHTHYKIAFINYIYRAFLSANGNEYKLYSDNILVSTPYLLDHIIKFHPYAFSLRNLELVPEVISETRSPELRYFIEELVEHLGRNHIRDAEVPLFDYKFYHKTFHEFNYLCKLFESESAAFNFTLDENYHIKLHIKSKIKELRGIHKEYISKDQNLSYVKSISFLNELLANSRYYDGEYDDAIVSYLDAVQPIEHYLQKEFNYEVLITYLLLQLKLGLTYEKMKDDRNAHAVYAETYSQLQGIIYKEIHKKDKKAHYKVDGIPWVIDILEMITQPVLAGIYLQEKTESMSTERMEDSVIKAEQLISLVASEDAKPLQFLVKAGIYSAVGTLMLYKNAAGNGNLNMYETDEFRHLTNYPQGSATVSVDFRTSAIAYVYLRKNIESLLAYNDNEVLSSCITNKKLSVIRLLQIAERFISTFVGNINVRNSKDNFVKRDRKYAISIAAGINRLADCLYSCLVYTTEDDWKNTTPPVKLDLLAAGFQNLPFHLTTNNEINWSFKGFSNRAHKPYVTPTDLFRLIMCMYHFSGQLYMRIGRNMECAFLFQKIIRSFRSHANANAIEAYNNVMEKYFVHKILQIASWNNKTADRYQAKKYEYIFSGTNFPELAKHNILNSSGSSEIREGLILFSEYRLAGNKLSADERNKIQKLITQYNIIPTQMTRYHELRLQVELNRKNVEEILNTSLANSISKIENFNITSTTPVLRLKKIVANSISCLYTIIAIYKGCGLNYWMSYSSLGRYYEHLGDWLTFYERLLKTDSTQNVAEKEKIETILHALLGKDAVRTLDRISQYQKALEHYSRAKQLHSEGTPYRSMTVNMYYLEDDFTDSLYLYGMAVERQRLNSGYIRNRINLLKEIVKNNGTTPATPGYYDYNYYI